MKRLLISVFVAFWIFAMMSCVTDKKAVNHVLAKPELKEKVGREWEKTNPCANDTITTSLTKSDTVITRDTVTNTITEQVTVPGKPIIQTVYKTITNTKVIHDSIKVYNSVVDTRRARIAEDSANFYRGVIIQKEGQIVAWKDEFKDMRGVKRKWQWFSIILLIIIAGFFTRKLWMPAVSRVV
jgi:hypothetical protein